MASKRNHDVLVLGGVAGGGLLAYEFLYKPWKAKQDAATTPLPFPSLGPMPIVSPPLVTGQPGSSSVKDPRVSPGGLVGEVMYRKNWPQQQAQQRLDELMAAYKTDTAAIAALRAQTGNPAAASLPQAQAQLQLNIQAMQNAQTRQAQDAAAGDALGAAKWEAAAAAHAQDIAELRQRISAAAAPPDNTIGIAAYEGHLATVKAAWLALTGQNIA